MNVVVNIDDAGKMLRKRGLEINGKVQRFFTNECAKHMDPYIPMQSGILKNTRVIKPNRVTYIMPYSQFHYYGMLMIGITSRSAYAMQGERKEVTDVELKHHGAPKRGPFWDRRMWSDKKFTIVNSTAKFAGGTPR